MSPCMFAVEKAVQFSLPLQSARQYSARQWVRAAQVDAPWRFCPLLRLPCSVYMPQGNPLQSWEHESLSFCRKRVIFHSCFIVILCIFFVCVCICVYLFCPDTLQLRYAFPLGLNVNRFYRLSATQTSASPTLIPEQHKWEKEHDFWAGSKEVFLNWKASASV